MAGWAALLKVHALLEESGAISNINAIPMAAEVLALCGCGISIIAFGFLAFAPPRHGTRGIAVAGICLGVIDLILVIAFCLLPALNVYAPPLKMDEIISQKMGGPLDLGGKVDPATQVADQFANRLVGLLVKL